MGSRQKAKDHFAQMQRLQSAHQADLLALKAKYQQAANMGKVKHDKSLKSQSERHKRQTADRLQDLEVLLRDSYQPSRLQKAGFQGYRQLNQEKEKEKYMVQVAVQIQRLKQQSQKQFSKIRGGLNKQLDRTLTKIKKCEQDEHRKLVQNQRLALNEHRYTYRQQRQRFGDSV